MERRMKEFEKQSQEIGETGREKLEEITERVVERIKETKRNEETRVKTKDDIEQVRRLKRIIEGKEKKGKIR